MMEITQNSLAVILLRAWRADLSGAAFGKRPAVYGHTDENGHAVHKRTVPKRLIADKMVQNGRLSGNLSEILDRLVEQSC